MHLAAKAGQGEGHLSKIVNNHLTPDPETVKKIAEALNISMSVLYVMILKVNDKVLIELIRELPDADLIEFYSFPCLEHPLTFTWQKTYQTATLVRK